ncbi:uncharacterized protein [Palaemon carinicauda]|uniref:uncharacterized protein n=1 Tax=Palaemon carinicauda TaxID=392227 RepID=UPI0035B5BDC0
MATSACQRIPCLDSVNNCQKDNMVVCKAKLSTLTEELGRVKSFNARLQMLEEAFSSRVPEDPQPQPSPQGDQHQVSSQSSRSHRQVRRCLDATTGGLHLTQLNAIQQH